MRPLPILLAAFLVLLSTAILAAAFRSNTKPASQPSFLGFDANFYPGDEALAVLRSTFAFTGFWLSPPPGEKHSTWLGKRALLESRGFGFLLLYNGRESRDLKSLVAARQKGQLDAQSAATLARREGFPPGMIIFLDIEEGGRLPDTYHEYVRAWFDELAQGGFHGGAYCSAVPVAGVTTAKNLSDHLEARKLALWVFNDACPPSPGCMFSNVPLLAESGFPSALVWQYAQSPRQKERTAKCVATYASDGNCYAPGDAGHKWLLDADTATTANPSAPRDRNSTDHSLNQ